MKKALRLLEDKTFCVITGAGLSTDSGIPDYRGEGSAPQKPLDFEPFIESAEYRKEFWIDGYKDWCDFSPAQPNDAHLAIALLDQIGFVNGVITQNVDGLHYKAGSEVVAELHGNMYTTSCLRCGFTVSTEEFVDLLELGNPSLLTNNVDTENFWVPNCSACAGPMKPDVTFFGELLPLGAFELAGEIAKDADVIVVAGTSLNVFTPMTFIQTAKSMGKPIIVINRGKTMVDKMANLKIHASVSDVFPELCNQLPMPVYI